MIKVFEYGLLPPTVGGDIVDEQIRLAHRYRNILVEIERERRTAVQHALDNHPLVAPHTARIQELEAQFEAARAVVLATRKAARKRAESPEQRAEVRRIGAELKAARGEARAARQLQDVKAEVALLRAAAEVRALKRVKEARKNCGVYWSSYLIAEQDASRARQEIGGPKFKRWTGEGRVSVQLQGGISLAELETDTQLQIHEAPISPARWAQRQEHARRSGNVARVPRFKLLRMRVGSTPGAKPHQRLPVWAEWPMPEDRGLPEGARIKTATVHRTKHGRNRSPWLWTLRMTVDLSACQARRPVPEGGVVALNLGWCQRPDGNIRAGYLVGSDGQEYEVLVKRRDLEALDKADSIRGFRDRDLNIMKAKLSEWRAAVAEAEIALPEWFESNTALWRSPARFAGLLRRWSASRFEGDEAGHTLLTAWCERDDHLRFYENGMRRTALLRRREAFRVLASQLAQRYHTLVVDDTDLREFHRGKAPESETVDIPAQKRQQQVAAPSELRYVMFNAFTHRTSQRSSVDVTRKHASCGTINIWDRAESERVHVCTGCYETYDIDANAGCNLLSDHARAVESGGEIADPTVPKKTGRGERLRAAKAAKKQAA